MEKKLLPGKTYDFFGTEYVVPGLTARGLHKVQSTNFEMFARVKEIQKKVKLIDQENPSDEDFDEMLKLGQEANNLDFEISCATAYAAFSRNYPEITYDEFCDLPTMAQMKEISVWVLLGESSIKKD